MAYKDHQDPRDYQVLKENQDLKVPLEYKVILATLDQREMMEDWGLQVNLVMLELLAPQEGMEHLEVEDHLAQKAQKVEKVMLVLLVLQDVMA